jgi:hypothetical protein
LFGKLIEDPEATNVTGQYDNFCGYYNVVPSEMPIDAEPLRSIEEMVEGYNKIFKTASVWAEPIPYNATTDGVFSASSLRQQQNDRLWESKRVSKEWEDWYSKWGATNGVDSRPPDPSGQLGPVGAQAAAVSHMPC